LAQAAFANRLKTSAPAHPACAAMAKEAPLVRWAGPPGVPEFLSEMRRRTALSEPDARPQGLARRTHARSASARSSSGSCASSLAADRLVQVRKLANFCIREGAFWADPDMPTEKEGAEPAGDVTQDAEHPPGADAGVALPHGQAGGEEDQPQRLRPPIFDVPEGFRALPDLQLNGTWRHFFWHVDSNLTDWDMTKLQTRIAHQECRVKAGLAAKAAERRAREEHERKAKEEADKQDRLAMFSVYRDLPPPGADLSVAGYLVSAPIFVDQVFLPQVQAFCFLVLAGQEELQRQQVDAAEAQAPLGFLEVPIISSWVRGGTESYDNIVARMYFSLRRVGPPCLMVGKCTFLAPLSERKKLVDMAASQSRRFVPEVPVQVVADVVAELTKGKNGAGDKDDGAGPRVMYACPKCELSFFKWQVCLNHCRGSPCTGLLRECLCPLRDDFADSSALQEACRQAAAK